MFLGRIDEAEAAAADGSIVIRSCARYGCVMSDRGRICWRVQFERADTFCGNDDYLGLALVILGNYRGEDI